MEATTLDILLGHQRCGSAKDCRRSQYDDAINTEAAAIRKPGETRESAVSRYLRTDTGKTLYGGYCAAQPDKVPVGAKPIRQITAAEITFNAAVGAIRKRDKVSAYQAIVTAGKEHKDLYLAARGQ